MNTFTLTIDKTCDDPRGAVSAILGQLVGHYVDIHYRGNFGPTIATGQLIGVERPYVTLLDPQDVTLTIGLESITEATYL